MGVRFDSFIAIFLIILCCSQSTAETFIKCEFVNIEEADQWMTLFNYRSDSLYDAGGNACVYGAKFSSGSGVKIQAMKRDDNSQRVQVQILRGNLGPFDHTTCRFSGNDHEIEDDRQSAIAAGIWVRFHAIYVFRGYPVHLGIYLAKNDEIENLPEPGDYSGLKEWCLRHRPEF